MSDQSLLKSKTTFVYSSFVDVADNASTDFEQRVVVRDEDGIDVALLRDRVSPHVIEDMLGWHTPLFHWGTPVDANHMLSAALIAHAHGAESAASLEARFPGLNLGELAVAYSTCVLARLPDDARWEMTSADVRADVNALAAAQRAEDGTLSEVLESQVGRMAERYGIPRLVLAQMPGGRAWALANDRTVELRYVVPAHLAQGATDAPFRVGADVAGRIFGPHFAHEDQVVRFQTYSRKTSADLKSASDIERVLRAQAREWAAEEPAKPFRGPAM